MCDYKRRPVGIRFRRIDGLERRRKRARSVAPDQALSVGSRFGGLDKWR